MNLLKTLIFLYIVPGTVLVRVPIHLGRDSRKSRQRGKAGEKLAVLAWIMGGVMLLWPMWNFVTVGRGSPSPASPPKELVVEGPYRFTRNPMYLAAGLVLLGHWFWSWSNRVLLYGLTVMSIFHLYVVLYEEPQLERQFGEAYRQYRHRTPRWMPKIESFQR
jgi:protein-S-isoprenylcysteine O-methyltransferase Ste14